MQQSNQPDPTLAMSQNSVDDYQPPQGADQTAVQQQTQVPPQIADAQAQAQTAGHEYGQDFGQAQVQLPPPPPSQQDSLSNASADLVSSADSLSSAVGAAGPSQTDSASISSGEAQTSPPPQDPQSLEAQNIFTLLGLELSQEEQDQFLIQLQDTVWRDFMDNDVPLLVTESEQQEVRQRQSAEGKSEEERQESVIEYLESLIPDLEELLMQKALLLKEDLFRERLRDSQRYYTRPDQQETLLRAEQALSERRYQDAASLVNSVS